MKLSCDTAGLCDAHKEGLPNSEKCPGMCDVPDCKAQGTIEVSDSLGELHFPAGCEDQDTVNVCAEHFFSIKPVGVFGL